MNLVDLGNVSSGVCQVRKCLQMELIFFFFAFKPKHLIQEQWFIHLIPKKLTQSLQSQRLQERWQRSKEYFERLPELMTGWHPESCKCLISIWKDKRSDFYISSSAMLHLTLGAATLFFFFYLSWRAHSLCQRVEKQKARSNTWNSSGRLCLCTQWRQCSGGTITAFQTYTEKSPLQCADCTVHVSGWKTTTTSFLTTNI